MDKDKQNNKVDNQKEDKKDGQESEMDKEKQNNKVGKEEEGKKEI